MTIELLQKCFAFVFFILVDLPALVLALSPRHLLIVEPKRCQFPL
jgi:hypothetical protein